MRLAVIPGDGIGPEVIAEALKVLEGVVPGVETTDTTSAPRAGTAPASCCPTRCCAELREHDAILLGAVGDPSCRPAFSSAACCCGCGSSSTTTSTCAPPGCTRACPARWRGDQAIDIWSCREGTEGPYAGNGGLLRKDTPHEIATEVSHQHLLRRRAGRPRRLRARRSAARRKHLTLVHKTNVLTYAGQLWSGSWRRCRWSTPTSRWPTSTSTPRRSTWSPTRAGST